MKRILVPTDFSPNADKAMHYAAAIAQAAGAELMLIHICSLPISMYSEDDEEINASNKMRIIELNGFLRRCKSELEQAGVLKVKATLFSGETVDTIVGVAEEKKADLIIMGTAGATGLKTVFGTRTASVIAKSKIPVIAVPYVYEWKIPSRILFALNHEEPESLLAPAFWLAQTFQAEVITALVSDKNEPAVELMEESRTIEQIHHKIEQLLPNTSPDIAHLEGDDICETLDAYIDEKKIDLVVMVTHRRNFIQRIFHASTTRRMAYHTHVPLLSLHS